MFRPEETHVVPSISVVGYGFCFPYLVDLVVKKKTIGLFRVRYDVLEDNKNLIFQVEGRFWQLKRKRIMTNTANFPILTMRGKGLAWHDQWTVHEGDSLDSSKILYTVKQKSHPLHIKTELEVFLADNIVRDIPDFRVIGCFTSQSFEVYKGDIIIAEVMDSGSFLLRSRKTFRVRVYPGVDHAFILSLLITFSEIDTGYHY
ncbi:hypothetical protein ACH5RR_040621 [Cinchona calisaya]|uniref:Uncharacterized protein n=1 Tax=Cinchona calisaya TaxID=153742 RepID=A0ABD2XUI1_9GENT